MDITQCGYPGPIVGHVGYFQFWLLQIKLPWTIMYRFLCGYKYSCLWDKCPKVGLLGYLKIYVQFEKIQPKYFPEGLYYFTFLPPEYETSSFSTSLPAFGIVIILYFSFFLIGM